MAWQRNSQQFVGAHSFWTPSQQYLQSLGVNPSLTHANFSNYPNQQHPYPPTTTSSNQHASGRGQPLLETQSSAQVLSQELAAAQRKLSQYTDMISNLHTELETIRNIVCHSCKERISPENLYQQTSAYSSQIPIVESHNWRSNDPVISSPHTVTAPNGFVPFPTSILSLGARNSHSLQTDFQKTHQTCSGLIPPCSPAAISDVHTRSGTTESFFTPPETPVTVSPGETTVVAKPVSGESRWSVKYNNEIKQSLRVVFLHAFRNTDPVYGVPFSPDGNFFAAGHRVGRTHIYDVKAMSMTCTLAQSGHSKQAHNIQCAKFNLGGKYLVTGDSWMIHIWDIASKRVLATFKGHRGLVRSLDVSPNGRLLVTGSFDKSVRIWKIRDGASKVLSTEGGEYTSVKFSPNGRYATASNADGFVRFWVVRSGHLIGKWKAHECRIQSLAFSPDGENLVSGSWDKSARCWDVSPLGSAEEQTLKNGIVKSMFLEKNKELEFDGHSGAVYVVAISPDGKWVMTGSADQCACIWDMHTAVQQCKLEGHSGGIVAVEFSPVGNYIAVGTADGSVMLWRYEPL